MTGLCAVPPSLRVDPEGVPRRPCTARRPTTRPSTCPVSGSCLERNRFYKGNGLHHVDRFVANPERRPGLRGRRHRERDVRLLRAPALGHRRAGGRARAALRRQQAGGQFFIEPGGTACACSCSTRAGRCSRTTRGSGRRSTSPSTAGALAREDGLLAWARPPTSTCCLSCRASRDERIYPLKGADVQKASSSRRATPRRGKAVSTRPRNPIGVAQAQILKETSSRSGSRSRSSRFPHPPVRQAGDAGRAVRHRLDRLARLDADSSILNRMFDGRTIAMRRTSGTSRTSTRRSTTGCSTRRRASPGRALPRLRRARRHALARRRAGDPVAGSTRRVRLRQVGCVVLNPSLDLTAVCLK